MIDGIMAIGLALFVVSIVTGSEWIISFIKRVYRANKQSKINED